MDQAVIDKLKAEHGELTLVEVGEHEFIVRCPKKAEYAAFRAMLFDESKRAYATEDLVRACVVAPDKKAFEVLLAQRPALPEVLAEHVLTLAKGSEISKAKKL